MAAHILIQKRFGTRCCSISFFLCDGINHILHFTWTNKLGVALILYSTVQCYNNLSRSFVSVFLLLVSVLMLLFPHYRWYLFVWTLNILTVIMGQHFMTLSVLLNRVCSAIDDKICLLLLVIVTQRDPNRCSRISWRLYEVIYHLSVSTEKAACSLIGLR